MQESWLPGANSCPRQPIRIHRPYRDERQKGKELPMLFQQEGPKDVATDDVHLIDHTDAPLQFEFAFMPRRSNESCTF
ncbi:hypothetical protein QWE_00710 [Agrobacterium albertimagni AOL15]|uniref:Uncharacterized protein n=1 Tax=Agrobacterium albertimagni AOL15 TaxID=1156935 RepID=K2PL70_9HYPH|nr:hypothetical protein QWE_00710 [Agrobacterium albertimagni AOL15]